MASADTSPFPDYANLLRLDGRRLLVIGAGQGIGRQTAHALAAVGAAVLCVDLNAELAQSVAAEIGGRAWSGDVTQRSEVERLIRDAEQMLGGIDGFVDIVGIATWKTIVELDDKTWNSQFDICLRHAYLISQAAAPKMIAAGGGTMVFIASVSGITGAPNHAAYGAAKAGLMAWMRSLCVELGPHGIRANAIAPGVVNTPRVVSLTSAAQQQANADNAPLRRNGIPADIASAALFLSAPLSGYVSGQTLVVDGGVTAKFPYPTVL
jgi:NAD(P)-dependent dehydrogenase (short-subunit alcohol dehydrogenase family)